MAGMNFKIPTVLTSEELMDKAYHRASKITKSGTNSLDARKKTALAKVTASGDIVKDTLDGYVNRFPRIEKAEDFFPELVDLVIGIDRYKKALGAVNWASDRTEKLKNESLREIRRTKDPAVIEASRNGFYGRLSSVIRRIGDDLEFLQSAKNTFRNIPAVDANVPTIVVAGFPNVGKSKTVTELSTAAPEIAPYPFTTKGIVIGHIEDGWRKYQIIDTPGLLDRELGERNDIEKQAILALKYLTHVILFIMDPSETCGFPMEKQLALMASVEEGFKGVPIIIAESKCDIMRTGNGRLCFSGETGENVDELRQLILGELRKIRLQTEEE